MEGQETNTSAVEPVVALAWGLDSKERRGPRPKFSLAEIVETAVRLADSQGLAGISMAKVAAELGFTTMSLYRYVSSKDDLLALMQDAAQGPAPQDNVAKDWRSGLEFWSIEVLKIHQKHPWLVDIPISGPPLMPNGLDWMELGLSYLNGIPLAPIEKLSTLSLFGSYVRGEALLSRDLERSRQKQQRTSEGEDDSYIAALTVLVPLRDFPNLASLIEPTPFASYQDEEIDDGDGFFLDFGLQRLLDGIERLIQQRSSSTASGKNISS